MVYYVNTAAVPDVSAIDPVTGRPYAREGTPEFERAYKPETDKMISPDERARRIAERDARMAAELAAAFEQWKAGVLVQGFACVQAPAGTSLNEGLSLGTDDDGNDLRLLRADRAHLFEAHGCSVVEVA